MAAYKKAILRMSARFDGLECHHVFRDSNQAADVLARMGAKQDLVPKNTFLERLFKPAVVWQDEDIGTTTNEATQIAPPPRPTEIEPDDYIIGGSALEETPSTHEIMAIIAPWTSPCLPTSCDRNSLMIKRRCDT